MPGNTPRKVRLPQNINPAIRSSRGWNVQGRPGAETHSPNRFEKWMSGWLLGNQGVTGAAKDFAHSVDPRSAQGAIGLAAMFAGKPTGENALAAHLGHSEFRPYNPPGFNHEGLLGPGDAHAHGGMMPGGGDIGYHNPSNAWGLLDDPTFKGVHGYSLPELLGLQKNKRVIPLNQENDVARLMHKPYRRLRGMNN